ncbi:Gfo/Idh/MocA family oxidoreductase [Mariniflexile litorale]|uniref:Gfo/Idh/MocA family oxidoreductase n=1 Tax=Mariniflexile litorale TaxID=3045158 RepID=A0AAU7EBR1_9FLAO|nr:Gfo/Idh/MocA family oxidoreductase [Mariniflexile sp. KMM 9835]MDQ8212862.1 Gfo/Idh/MocA family oxidoreductase [Mariniflexile sp. KMM 9835]
MKTLGIGIVGVRYGAHMHYENFKKLPPGLIELRGVCSRTLESAEAFASKTGITFVTNNIDELLAREDIDIIDICTPPATHHEIAIKAAQAGKHIIMEKPLTGYFGEPGDKEPIGFHVPRARMLAGALKNAEAIREAVRSNGVIFCYAENWVYAPPVVKMRNLIAASKGAILEVRAEENHSGSNSVFSREWKHTGGGALLRMGSHSVGACLHLKHWEGMERLGKSIRPVSVMADTADLIHTDASNRAKKANAHNWISSNPVDVEDWANVTIKFDDGSRATVLVSDVGLGGLNTRITTFMTDGVIKANMTANNAIETYAVDPETFSNEYFTEKLETKAGWNRPSCDEDWFRGFIQEITDFVDAIQNNREPLAGIDLAVDCVNVIYSAYLSAEQGKRVNL